jgi:hypothetical protein
VAPAAGLLASRRAAPARPDEGEPGPLFLVAAYAVLFVFGATAGLLGSFLLSAGPRIGATLALPVGLVLALVLHPLAGYLGHLLTATRAGILTPLVGWAAVVLPLSVGTSEGDVVLPGNTLSLIYLVLGVLMFGVPAVVTRPTRGRSAWPRG